MGGIMVKMIVRMLACVVIFWCSPVQARQITLSCKRCSGVACPAFPVTIDLGRRVATEHWPIGTKRSYRTEISDEFIWWDTSVLNRLTGELRTSCNLPIREVCDGGYQVGQCTEVQRRIGE